MMAVHAQFASNTLIPDFPASSTSRAINNHDLCNASASSRKRDRDVAAEDIVVHHQHYPFPSTSKIQSVHNYQRNRLSQPISEIEQLIRLHSVNIKSRIDEIQQKHCRELTQMLEAHASKRIAQKDAEIETLKRARAELEATLKQVTAENRSWFAAARHSESLVAGLKASLDQALRSRNVAGGGGECDVAGAQAAEDAESCCNEGGIEDRRRPVRGVCRVCSERSVSVLVLPCRHLCLCPQCEPVSDKCPICYAAKNVGLLVFVE